MAHKHGVPLIVDNTVATPILLRPIEYGADIVVHSLTKFMGGHGTTLGGAIVDSGNFDWKEHASRFPMFSQPDPSYHGLVYTDISGRLRTWALPQRLSADHGAVLSPLSAFLLLQGIETVALRVSAMWRTAEKWPSFCASDPRVEWVKYAGFPDSPYHALAQKYLGGRACSLMTVGIKGGFAAPSEFHDALKLVTRLVNLGDAKSLACHPASTTHRQMSAEEQRKRRSDAGDDPAQHRDRTHRRHHRGPGSGACRGRMRLVDAPEAVITVSGRRADASSCGLRTIHAHEQASREMALVNAALQSFRSSRADASGSA